MSESRAGRVYWSSVIFLLCPHSLCNLLLQLLCHISAHNTRDATTSGKFGFRDHFWSLLQVQRLFHAKSRWAHNSCNNTVFLSSTNVNALGAIGKKTPHTNRKGESTDVTALVWGENCCLWSNSLICSSLVQLAINFEEKTTFVFTVSEGPEVPEEKKTEIKVVFLGFRQFDSV